MIQDPGHKTEGKKIKEIKTYRDSFSTTKQEQGITYS